MGRDTVGCTIRLEEIVTRIEKREGFEAEG